MGDVLVAPARAGEQSRLGPGLWRKHALPFGPFAYDDPRTGERRVINVTPDFAEKLKANFDGRVRDKVQVSAKGEGGHSDDWRDAKGDTVGVEIDPDKGLYVTLAVDDEVDSAIAEKRLAGVSLAFDENYFCPRRMEKLGPVLRHTAVTNVPYLKGLEGFQPVTALAEPGDVYIMLAEVPAPPKPKEDSGPMDLDQLKALLKKDHKIDLDALIAGDEKLKAEAGSATKLRAALKLSGVELSETATDADYEAAGAALAEQKAKADGAVQLSERVGTLETTLADQEKAHKRERAEAMVRPYVVKGLVGEGEKAPYVELAEANPALAQTALKGLSGGVLLTELAVAVDPSPLNPSNADVLAATDPKTGEVVLSEAGQSELERLRKQAAEQLGYAKAS